MKELFINWKASWDLVVAYQLLIAIAVPLYVNAEL